MNNNEGKEYYSIKDIVAELEKLGIKRKKANTILQWFYRLNMPFIWGKADNTKLQCKLYAKAEADKILKYFSNLIRIKEYRAEFKKQFEEKCFDLIAENKEFRKKYQKKSS